MKLKINAYAAFTLLLFVLSVIIMDWKTLVGVFLFTWANNRQQKL
jgi:hypothetical protein